MTLSKILINKLKITACESSITQKHACAAIIGNKQISPAFFNYNRQIVLGNVCGGMHSEMAVINYILNSL